MAHEIPVYPESESIALYSDSARLFMRWYLKYVGF